MPMIRRLLFPAAAVAAATLAFAGCSRTESTETWRDPSIGVEQRAADLVAQMTLEEKAEQVGHTAPAIPRLGVPEYNWWNEGLHGVARAGIATVFPQAIGMASSWDVPLMHDVADVISDEFRAKFLTTVHPDGGTDWYRGLTVWSPNINIFRDPRWGRGQETYGEDPYLTAQIAIAFIHGLQGDDPNFFKTIATSKHYAVHSGPESTRHTEDIHPSAHDLEDTYLPAFHDTVVDGGVDSIMCAYNAVDGIPACANEMLLKTRLREAWGFKGYVVSDCGAAANIFRKDALAYTDDPAKGVALAFEAGMDVICGDYRNDMSTESEHIVDAVERGLLDEAVLDRALRRLFEARIRLGLFDPHYPFPDIKPDDYDTEAHNALALRMAQKSMVLLKNKGNLLPLRKAPPTIAVIGPNADSLDALLGNYNGIPSHPVTVVDGIRARFADSKVIYAQGTGLIGKASPQVPDDALCVDSDCSNHGLTEEAFADSTLSGTATETNVEPNVSVMWAGTDRNTATRWTGFLRAPKSGSYRVRLDSDNGYRIWVDDKLVADTWDVGEDGSSTATDVELEQGLTYALRIEAIQSGRRGYQRLLWDPPGDRAEEAVAAAESADLVVFVGGLDATIEGEEMDVEAPGFSGGDRTSLDLPAPQEQLLERVYATGKPVVLVLMSGSALGVNWADANVPAIVEAWYPGGSGGTAVAGLLAGDYSPAGRLPVTFYKSVDQLPPFDDYAMAGRTYRYFEGEPLYPFGYGLSYTEFAYSNPQVSPVAIGVGDTVTISVDVVNTGDMDGDEVVQLYLSHPGADGAPIRSLEGFRRIHLAKGEMQRVEFPLSGRRLSVVDSDGVRRIDPGTVDVWIGGGQPVSREGLAEATGVEAQFEVTESSVLPE
jgi:beta-glucosidase